MSGINAYDQTGRRVTDAANFSDESRLKIIPSSHCHRLRGDGRYDSSTAVGRRLTRSHQEPDFPAKCPISLWHPRDMEGLALLLTFGECRCGNLLSGLLSRRSSPLTRVSRLSLQVSEQF